MIRENPEKSIHERYDDLWFECARLSNTNQVLRNNLKCAQEELRRRPPLTRVTQLFSMATDSLISLLVVMIILAFMWVIGDGWSWWEYLLVGWAILAALARAYGLFQMLRERQ